MSPVGGLDRLSGMQACFTRGADDAGVAFGDAARAGSPGVEERVSERRRRCLDRLAKRGSRGRGRAGGGGFFSGGVVINVSFRCGQFAWAAYQAGGVISVIARLSAVCRANVEHLAHVQVSGRARDACRRREELVHVDDANRWGASADET